MATLSECIRIHLDDPGDNWLADMIRRRATELAGGNRVSAAVAKKAVGDVLADFEREVAEVEEQLRELLYSSKPKKIEKAPPEDLRPAIEDDRVPPMVNAWIEEFAGSATVEDGIYILEGKKNRRLVEEMSRDLERPGAFAGPKVTRTKSSGLGAADIYTYERPHGTIRILLSRDDQGRWNEGVTIQYRPGGRQKYQGATGKKEPSAPAPKATDSTPGQAPTAGIWQTGRDEMRGKPSFTAEDSAPVRAMNPITLKTVTIKKDSLQVFDRAGKKVPYSIKIERATWLDAPSLKYGYTVMDQETSMPVARRMDKSINEALKTLDHYLATKEALASGQLTPERAEELGHFDLYPGLQQSFSKAPRVSDRPAGEMAGMSDAEIDQALDEVLGAEAEGEQTGTAAQWPAQMETAAPETPVEQAGPATLGPGMTGTKDGRPFKNAGAARFVMNQQGLADSHEIVRVPGGFALKAKAQAPAAAEEETIEFEVRPFGSQRTETLRVPKSPKPKSAGQLAGKAKKEIGEAVRHTLAGLDALFGGANRLSSGLTFDEDTYAKAKPHFQAALESAVAAGHTLADLIRFLFERYGVGIRPYLRRFMQEQAALDKTGPARDSETKAEEVPDEIRGEGAGGDRGRTEAQGAVDQEQRTGELHPEPGTSPAPRDGADDRGRDAAEDGRGDREPGTADTRPVDYRITADDHLGEGGPKSKFKDNLAAIRVLKRLGDDGIATAEDQKILVKYVGWGGMPQAFYKPDGTVAKGWEKEAAELKGLLTPEEYAAARRSTQDAHYTSRQVVDGIYAGLARLGFTGGRVLEPSVGTGNFIGLMPEAVKNASRVTAIELDPTTAAIARHLYPLQRVINSGFQDVTIAEGSYDLAVGNPPFGDTKLFDPANKDLRRFSIHNFFFAKSIKALRPDGILAMVVSSHLMDKLSPAEREWMAARCELLGAVRLPSTAFAANAGTEVTTDIIFLRKRREQEPADTGPRWTEIRRVKGADGITYRINEYFAAHPEQMLGELGHNKLQPKSAEEIIRDSFYDAVPGLLPKPGGPPLEVQLVGALMNLPQDVYRAGQSFEDVQRPEIVVSEPGFAQPYGFALSDDGQAVRRLADVNGEMQWEPVLYGDKPLDGKRLERFVAMLKVRDAVRRLMRAELADDPKMEQYRAALNRAYDRFVAEYGYFSDNANKLVFGSDSTDYPLLRSLERDYDKGLSKTMARKTGDKPRPPSAKKASIFTKRLREPYREVTRADTPADALAVVLRENGRIDLDRICALCGRDEDAVMAALGKDDLIFQDPADGQWRTRQEYLSGNVKRKLAEARAAGMTRNVAALEKVQPEDVAPAQIKVNLGAPWMPREIYEAFASEELGATMTIEHHEAVGRWSVITRSYDPAGRFSTSRMAGAKIYERLLQGKDIAVYDTDSDGKRVLNPERTEEAKAAAREMEQHFATWLLADPERAEAMAREFNRKVNTHVEATWDGSHMIFPGMGTINPDVARDDQLNPHQKNAAWRLIQKGYGLLDHVVGAGKTFAAIAAGMEMRRMGLARKPMYVVPNRLVDQWASDFQLLYPGANVLVIGKKDFEKKRRQEFMARIATGDWDAVVLAHSSFGFIQAPLDYERRFIQQQIDDWQAAIEEMRRAAGKKDRTVKEAENARDKLKNRLRELNSAARDQVVDFADLGVDALFVDEAHEFKNLFYITSHSRVAGLGDKKGSQKAFNLFLKTRYLQEAQNGRGVFFLTGTPVSNTIAEMYTMMRYLAYDQLVEAGMRHFDQWANNFAAITSDWEVDPSGTRYRLQARFREFVNVPGMMGIYKDFADVITQQNLIDQAEEAGQVWPVPKIRGGKPENVVVERSEDQASYMRYVVWRMDHMPDDPRQDNPLKATGEAMKASLDMRLIDPSLPDHPGSKVNAAVRRIMDIYRQWDEQRGTQLVFCDLSVPKQQAAKHRERVVALRRQVAELEQAMAEETDSDRLAELEEQYEEVAKAFEKLTPAEIMAADQGDFSVYDDLREKLVAAGMKPSEVAFIHDANTEQQTRDLFDKVNRGEVRVLIGSTSKMGAGMNVQERLVALHHLDAPWRPSDLEQREGRIVRRGNRFFNDSLKAGGPLFEVRVLRYATKESLDTRRWQIIEAKARVVEQLRTGGHQWGESIEDTGGEASNAAEMKAETSGNPLILEEVQLRKRIADLEARRRNHENQRLQAEAAKRRYEKLKRELDDTLKAIDELAAGVTEDAAGDPARWEITVDGKRIAAKGVVEVPAKLTEADVAGIADEKQRKRALADNKAEIKRAEEHNKKALAEAKNEWADWIRQAVFEAMEENTDHEIVYRGVEFYMVWSEWAKQAKISVDSGVVDHFNGVDPFTLNPGDVSPEGVLVRLKNRIDKIAAGVDHAKRRAAFWVDYYKEKFDNLKPHLEKKFEEQEALEEARARHTEVLTQVRQVDQNAPPPDDDIKRWANVRPTVQRPARREAVAGQAAAADSGFYISIRDQGFKTPEELGYKSVKEVPAAEVGAPEEMTFFVYQNPKATAPQSRWVVSEARSGVRVGAGKTRKDAIETAKEIIERTGEERLREAVDAQVAANGESPWATGRKPDMRRGEARRERAAGIEDARAVFKGQDVGLNDDGSVWVKTAGGAKVTIRRVRWVDDGTVGVQASVGSRDDEALGRYFEREIQLQRDAAGRITLRHEAEHFMERAGLLRGPEIAALRRHIQALVKKGQWTPEDPEDIGGMEDRAEWVARHINERETMHGQLRKLLDRVWDFVNHLWNLAARTLGLENLTSAAGVVADIQSGYLFDRPAPARDRLVEGDEDYEPAADEGHPPPALFRRRRQAAREIEADTLSFMEKIKAARRPAQLTEGRPDDLNYVRDLILRTPAFFAEKLHGTKQIYRAAQRKRDEAEALARHMEQHDDINAVKLWDTLSVEDRKGANDYLVKADEEASGYRIRLSRDGRHWQVMSQQGQVVAHFESRPDPEDPYNDLGEIEAAARRRDLEKRALREAGMSDAQIGVIMAWRLSTDKGFDLLVRDMRRAEALAKRTGAPAPMVTIEKDGKPVRISMKEAMARMGELRGHYFPRIRKRGRFVLKATKSGQASRREHFTSGPALNVRAATLRRQGWTVTTEPAREVGEDVFSLDGGLVKTQQMVNAALEAVEKRMKSAAPLEGDALAEELRSAQEIFASALGEQIAAVIRARGARGHMIRRNEELWKGYEEDAQVALSKYIRGLAGAEAKRRMVVRMMRALTGTEISREDFEEALKFTGDYDAFMTEADLEDPAAMTEEAFAAINDPVGYRDNQEDIAALDGMLADTTDEAERKKLGENIAEKKRWVAERYEKYVRAMGIDQRRQPKAFKWAKAFIEENTRNPEPADRVINTIRGLAVAKYLAFRVFSAPVVNLTALPTSVIATLKGAGIPYADTWRHLTAALGDYLTYRRGKKFEDPEKQRVFDHIRRNGWDNAQFNSEAMATLRGAVGRTWDKVLEYGMLTFSESERCNRAATIAAAYYGLRAKHPDISFEKLMERARKVSDDAHGVYNKGNYPFIALGRHPAAHVARMFNVFKVFAHTYLQNMVRLGFTEKDYGALAHMVLAPAALAGLGSSAMMPVIHVVARAFGADEPEEELYDKIGAVFGLTAEELARHGLVGQLGFTIKGSLAVGVGDLPTNLKDLIGAPGSVVTDLYQALGYAGRGDVLKAIEAAAPTGVGNIAKAVREYSQGITTASNRPVFWGKEQLRPTLTEAFWRGFGFNPTRIATARERQWKEYRVEQQYDKRRGDIYARFRGYVADGRRDPETLAEIMGEVARFNEDAGRWNLAPITVKRLESAAEAKPSRRERARDEDAGRWRLADPDTEAGRLIGDLERRGYLEIREPSRAVVYRHRRYEMPEAAYDTYRERSTEIARRKIERALWRLKALKPERQAEEIGKILSAARRQARQAGRRAALMAGPVE